MCELDVSRALSNNLARSFFTVMDEQTSKSVRFACDTKHGTPLPSVAFFRKAGCCGHEINKTQTPKKRRQICCCVSRSCGLLPRVPNFGFSISCERNNVFKLRPHHAHWHSGSSFRRTQYFITDSCFCQGFCQNEPDGI